MVGEVVYFKDGPGSDIMIGSGEGHVRAVWDYDGTKAMASMEEAATVAAQRALKKTEALAGAAAQDLVEARVRLLADAQHPAAPAMAAQALKMMGRVAVAD